MKDSGTGWYLVLTKPRQENIADANLQRQGFHVYVPLLQQHKRQRNLYQIVTEPLFPRYIFIQLSMGKDDWSKLRSTRGCVSLVRFGMQPARVPDILIEQLKNDENKRLIQADQLREPLFKPGDKVRVLDGLLAGYEGIIESKNSRERVLLLLNIAEGHTRSINLPIHLIEKVS